MNKIDKGMYRSLRFLSQIKLKNVLKLKEENLKEYNRFVPRGMEDFLETLGYISFKSDKRQESSCPITLPGLEQLRILEDMRRKGLTLIVSVIAITISAFAFAKSMGWI